ncbi:hypothetical protein P5673_000506 [Acropora cervicornis]|uniref:Uncharacterized protein n=1 Tax=Acropora cervicornis TaxID=6130 RepID=A0AAD9VH59_ACRCE|nr:hypothetical protein P5673_000506 [Acropora cervicornis]
METDLFSISLLTEFLYFYSKKGGGNPPNVSGPVLGIMSTNIVFTGEGKGVGSDKCTFQWAPKRGQPPLSGGKKLRKQYERNAGVEIKMADEAKQKATHHSGAKFTDEWRGRLRFQ